MVKCETLIYVDIYIYIYIYRYIHNIENLLLKREMLKYISYRGRKSNNFPTSFDCGFF